MDGSVPSGNQLVIVALPSENDYVRKVSSEIEPHLTLLYLGENKFDSAQIVQISEYVEYASSMFYPFMLDVESRGELGPQKADVLFFDKKSANRLEAFRAQLLQNDLISAAYNSVNQFPEWIPHLTMGYPENPAKKDDREYSQFSYVSFDRIALWTDNYAGPEFQLKFRDYDLDVAMSQIERGRSAMVDVLEHYGIKGMKWGVRRSQAQLDSASGRTPSTDAKVAAAAQAKVNVGGTKVLSNNELQSLVNRMNLERQYQTMVAQNRTSMDRGLQTTQKILKVGKTAEDVRKFMETPTGKAVKRSLKGAFAAAKVAAAFKTGGVSSAAGAGASLAVRRMNNHYTNVG